MKILIVDDEVEICSSLCTMLQFRGFEVDTANNGEGAIEKLKETKFDLVMSDINMPNMDGVALLKHVVEFHPKLPMILMTGYAEYQEDHLLKIGAKKVLQKPFNTKTLLDVLTQYKPE